jgi:hypothetical protein
VGVSQAQFFGSYLATIELNKKRVEFEGLDLSYLRKVVAVPDDSTYSRYEYRAFAEFYTCSRYMCVQLLYNLE